MTGTELRLIAAAAIIGLRVPRRITSLVHRVRTGSSGFAPTPRSSAIGEAVTSATNQWPTLGVFIADGRLTIDNAPAEQAIRPLCVGRRNWLHPGGDGGLRPTTKLLSVTASVEKHGVNPWIYLKHVLTELPSRPAGADVTELLPDLWTTPRASPTSVAA